MRTRTRSLVGTSWLAILAACTGGQTGDEGPSRRPDAGQPTDAGATGEDFFDSIRGGFGNYDAARSLAELADRSERIAVGTIAALLEGRPFAMSSGESTAMVELAVSEVLKGEPAERLYIELYVGFVFDAPYVPDPLPENRLVVFLIPAGDTHVSGGSPELPEGEMLYTPTTAQGVMVERDSGSVDTVDFFPEPASFEGLIDTLRDAAP